MPEKNDPAWVMVLRVLWLTVLRDYFAGQALVGAMAHQKEAMAVDLWATRAYALADAMLAARKEQP